MTNPKPNFEINADTALLLQYLRKVSIGGNVTYVQLAEVISKKEPLEGSNSQLQSALRKCAKDGIHFDNIRGVGYRRMNDGEIVLASDRDVKRAHRAAKRHMKRLGSADYEKLTSEEKTKFNINATVLGAVNQFTGKKSINEIEKKVIEVGSRLPIAQTLEAFSK